MGLNGGGTWWHGSCLVVYTMTTNKYISNTFRLTFNYAGRGIVLGALAMSLAFAGCDDGEDGPNTTDAAVDAAGGGDTGTDTKVTDTAAIPDAAKDTATTDAKPADAGGDAAVNG